MRWNTLLNPLSLVLAASALCLSLRWRRLRRSQADFDPNVPGSEACLGPVVADLPAAAEDETTGSGEEKRFVSGGLWGRSLDDDAAGSGFPAV